MAQWNSANIAHSFTFKVILGMLLGLLFGLSLHFLPYPLVFKNFFVYGVDLGGQLFLTALKMLVVPIVLVSLICGSSSLGNLSSLGRIGGKTLLLYLVTTALAISLAIALTALLGIGKGMAVPAQDIASFAVDPLVKTSSPMEVLKNLFPANIFTALSSGHMLQIIMFSLLIGIAISATGKAAEPVRQVFESMNAVLIKLVHMVMWVAPYGVFCLLAMQFSKMGYTLLLDLLNYSAVLLLVLALQLLIVYPSLLKLLSGLNPLVFLRSMFGAMTFAFSVSSSNASIPVVMQTVEKRLGVKKTIASFVVPLGATINMDGTAIMQGVATVFVAHLYGIPLGLMDYVIVVALATLASIGTAGIPSVGLVMLILVFQQLGLPIEAIGMLLGIDRLLDMARTAVNVTGDAMVSCIVGKSEKALNEEVFYEAQA